MDYAIDEPPSGWSAAIIDDARNRARRRRVRIAAAISFVVAVAAWLSIVRPDPPKGAVDAGSPTAPMAATYSDFIAAANGDGDFPPIASVEIHTATDAVDVVNRDGTSYSVGFPTNTEKQLIDFLGQRGIRVAVVSGG